MIRIHGDGTTRRSYLYGSDAAAWLLKVLVAGREDNEVYNIGGSEPVSQGEPRPGSRSELPQPELVYKSQPRDSRPQA